MLVQEFRSHMRQELQSQDWSRAFEQASHTVEVKDVEVVWCMGTWWLDVYFTDQCGVSRLQDELGTVLSFLLKHHQAAKLRSL